MEESVLGAKDMEGRVMASSAWNTMCDSLRKQLQPSLEEGKKENSSSGLDKANVEGRPDEHCELIADAIGAKGKQGTRGGCRDWGRASWR